MKYRITIEEWARAYAGNGPDAASNEQFVPTDVLESQDSKVVAAFLRGKADKLDPPERLR
jgi:hypothetical protein